MKKITKRDIDSIITDNNILIGVEFEFYFKDFLGDFSKNYYNILYDQWLIFIEALRKLQTGKTGATFPDIPIELSKYFVDYMEEVDLKNVNISEFEKNPNSFINKIFDLQPDIFITDNGDNEALDKAVKFISDSLGLNVIKNNKPSKQGDNWGLELDMSLKTYRYGFELISPPLPMPEFLNITPKILNFINKNGITDETTGFHVHMSIKGVDLKNDLNVMKLLMFNDDDLTYKYFNNRKLSKHARPIKNKIENLRLTKDDIYSIMDVDKVKKMLKIKDRNYGINLNSLDYNNIEYRYMGDAGYDKKWKEMRELVIRYAFNLKIAVNENLMRRKYLKKMFKITELNEE